jgi:WD40 repeat protein
VISLAGGKELLNIQTHTDWVFGTALTDGGSKLVTTSRDKAVKLIQLPAGQPIVDVAEPKEPGTCLAVSPDGKMAVMGAANGEPRVYRVANPAGTTNAVAWSPDGEWFAAAGVGEAKVYKKTGERSATLAGHAGPVHAVAFSPDGKFVYTAGFDAKVRVFEAKAGKLAREFVPEPWAKAAGVK